MNAATQAIDAAPVHEKAILRDYCETILICVIFVIFSRAFVFQQSKIPSGSMMDTLLIGDYIMVNRFVYAPTSFAWERALLPVRPIRRGDVVVFKQPDEPEIDFIKRVVGLPGDVVELRDGVLFVNGERIEEPYVKPIYRQRDDKKDFGPWEVSEDHYLVFGDHRNRSQDSRYWGEVPRGLMKGRALLTWWSFYDPEEHEYSGINVPIDRRSRGWAKKGLYALRPCGKVEKDYRRTDEQDRRRADGQERRRDPRGRPCTEFGRCFTIIR